MGSGRGVGAHFLSSARATHRSWRWPTLQFSPDSVTREARPFMPATMSCSRHQALSVRFEPKAV